MKPLTDLEAQLLAELFHTSPLPLASQPRQYHATYFSLIERGLLAWSDGGLTLTIAGERAIDAWVADARPVAVRLPSPLELGLLLLASLGMLLLVLLGVRI